MVDFHISEQEWYRRRDDRTSLNPGVEKYQEFSIGIIVFDDLENNFSNQAMLLIAVNIISRWCRKIRIQLKDSNCCLPGYGAETMKTILEKTMMKADPFGDYTFGKLTNDLDQILMVGNAPKDFRQPHYWINSNGWLAGVGFGKERNNPILEKSENIIGPAFSACLGASELFKLANGIGNQEEFETWTSLLNFETSTEIKDLQNSTWPSKLELGRILLIGCGAIGSSFSYLLNLTNWIGKLDLVDDDIIKSENCSCSLIFSYDVADKNLKKVDVCKNHLAASQIEVKTFGVDYSNYVKSGRNVDFSPDLILCLANEKNIWQTIQHNYPPLTLNGTTTASWGINFGRHIPKKEWCILCEFSKNVKTEFKPICGLGEVGTGFNDQPVLGTLPFLSPASAVLLFAEFTKIVLELSPEVEAYNFINYSLRPLMAKGQFITALRSSDPNCICSTQRMDIHLKFAGKSKFWVKATKDGPIPKGN
jgi:hypothetical protein